MDLYLAVDDKLRKIFSFKERRVSRILTINRFDVNIFRLVDFTPSIYAKSFESHNEFVERLTRKVAKVLRDKKVVLWFSGGKDSLSALITLVKLQEQVNFDLRAYYIHVPYLDGERNIRFAERVAEKLSMDIVFTGISKEKMLDLLKSFGMPFRGFRWCTYHTKVKLMRQIKRKEKADFEVTSERIFESLKRYKGLLDYIKKDTYISGGQFKPVYHLTLPDIKTIMLENNLVHPDYLMGCTRVSCSLCPYRTIMELKKTYRDIEDPGLIDQIISENYRKYYGNIPYEDYITEALWRFSPKQALVVLELKKLVSSYVEELSMGMLDATIGESWRINNAPTIDYNMMREKILNSDYNYGVLNLNDYGLYF